MARWRFLLLDFDVNPTNFIAHEAEHPSSFVLPVIPNIEVPTPLPPASSLRAQPWRTYVPFTNAQAELL